MDNARIVELLQRISADARREGVLVEEGGEGDQYALGHDVASERIADEIDAVIEQIVTDGERILRGPLSMEARVGRNAMRLTVWNPDNMHRDAIVDIPTHRLPEFIRNVSNVGMTVIESSVGRIATGDCYTCRNTGLVVVEREDREPERVRCPDCTMHRVTGLEALAVAPDFDRTEEPSP